MNCHQPDLSHGNKGLQCNEAARVWRGGNFTHQALSPIHWRGIYGGGGRQLANTNYLQQVVYGVRYLEASGGNLSIRYRKQ